MRLRFVPAQSSWNRRAEVGARGFSEEGGDAMRDCPDAAGAGHCRKTRHDRRDLPTQHPLPSSNFTIDTVIRRDTYLY